MFVVVALVFLAAPPLAPETAFLDERARNAYVNGRYERALELFMELHEATPDARTLFNLALTAELARRPSLAYGYWNRYIQGGEDRDAKRQAIARKHRRTLARRLSLVTIETTPAGADIYIDRREHGRYGATPATLALTPGPHTIDLVHRDYLPVRRAVRAKRGQQTSMRIVMRPRMGRIAVSTTPRDAQLFLRRDDIEFRVAPGVTSTVPAGAYTVTATQAGYRAATVRVLVRADAVERRMLILERIPRPSGRLLVTAGSRTANVWIDGEQRATTPVTLDLESGSHEVVLRTRGVRRFSRNVRIEPGETTLIEATW